ncbi:putative nuclease HARBI1 [Coccinella septempunctata]|uniref:putative nuclease HARBI1 n=1 Tax=Coccinella septempunctata TaxID=41139 RepID=UPI001D08EDE2|nr:putative nuclease HARBI1 [Coccinella septempunctata]
MDEDEVFLLNIILENVEHAEIEAGSIPRLLFHNREDPLERLSDNQFVKHFRLTKKAFRKLYQELTELLNLPNLRQSALTFKTKLLVSLMFFGQGSYQSILGSNVFTGMSQASVSRCIEEITTALNMNVMQQRWIHFPKDMNELTRRRARFYNATRIPGGIGIIDCTHVAIVMPSEEEHIYVNRKNYHSLNVQLICDESLKIMHVNSQFPGSTHNAYIWNQSNISYI